MATKAKSSTPVHYDPPGFSDFAYFKDDSISVDTSKAPWMEIARQELEKQIKENEDYDSFAKLFFTSLVEHETEHHFLTESLRSEGLSALEGGNKGTAQVLPLKERHPLLKEVLYDQMGRDLRSKNLEIDKYFTDLKTDPDRDRRRRTWGVSPVTSRSQNWRVTAWCAAFVNWCLKKAGAPHLGMATAASWLKFGTPLAKPVYGCVTVVKPSKSTGSTTGHVAFYVGTKGDRIGLLGGNQMVSREVHGVTLSYGHHLNQVMGYRWPTAFNHYLLDKRTSVV